MSTIIDEDPPVTTAPLPPVKTLYQIYSVPIYSNATKQFIKSGYREYTLEDLATRLQTKDRAYHTRIHKKGVYNFFGDLDNYQGTFPEFAKILVWFLNKHYDIPVSEGDIMYTENKGKQGSFHYSIPSIHCSCEKLKKIHTALLKAYPTEFTHNGQNCIDTTIYSEHWFRLPMQMKESVPGTQHTIVVGDIRNFIPEYIHTGSVCIENSGFTKTVSIKPPPTSDNIIKSIETPDEHLVIRLLFDRCYKPARSTNYDTWTSVGMALAHEYGYTSNAEAAFELFDYFSSSASNYGGTIATRNKYNSFEKETQNNRGYTIATVYYYARQDNPTLYKEIISGITALNFEDANYGKKIRELAGDRFVYMNEEGGEQVLHCYVDGRWKRSDIPLRTYIQTELYKYYRGFVRQLYADTDVYLKMLNKISALLKLPFIKSVVENYKSYGISDVQFDCNPYLFGFNNCVYDLEVGEFREYRYSDYITMTTGYDYIEPTVEEVNKIESLIEMIMQVPEERLLYMEIMCSALLGRTLEKFFVFTGEGRNGKGAICDLYVNAFGDYAIIANNAILSETSKTGACPEKANMHKKRLIIFREPSEKNRIQNSVVKELTGGSTFTCRKLYSGTCHQDMYGTIILETNKKPLLAEQSLTAEIERIIDLPFRSTFTTNPDDIDHSKLIYEADHELKSERFQVQHRCAMMKIMFDYYKIFSTNNLKFTVPLHIIERTFDYIAKSDDILQWFLDNYEKSDDPKAQVKTKDVHAHFMESGCYRSATNAQKSQYSKPSWFAEYIAKIPALKGCCVISNKTKVIKGYIPTTDF